MLFSGSDKLDWKHIQVSLIKICTLSYQSMVIQFLVFTVDL